MGSRSQDEGFEIFMVQSNVILKNIIYIIVYPITYGINWTPYEGIFPDCLNIEITALLYKMWTGVILLDTIRFL